MIMMSNKGIACFIVFPDTENMVWINDFIPDLYYWRIYDNLSDFMTAILNF